MESIIKETNPIFFVRKPESWSSPTSHKSISRRRRIPSRTYQVTNDEQRARFIQKVIGSKLTIREVKTSSFNFQAAEASNIRYSTAKTILKVYKCEGRVEKKKKRTKKGCIKMEEEQKTPPVRVDRNCETEKVHSISAIQHLKFDSKLEKEGSILKGYTLSTCLPSGFWAFHITAHLSPEETAPSTPLQKLTSQSVDYTKNLINSDITSRPYNNIVYLIIYISIYIQSSKSNFLPMALPCEEIDNNISQSQG